jgi:predicted Zn-dependent protease
MAAGVLFQMVNASFAEDQSRNTLPDNDVVIKAMVDEMNRSMADLKLENLDAPYFMKYGANDSVNHSIQASRGALLSSDHTRRRSFQCTIRVGDQDLDNTNYLGGRGGTGSTFLPIDDDYLAIRQAIWNATDSAYKSAAETIAQKRAYLKDKTIEDRPPDFSAVEPVVHIEPGAELVFDEKKWEGIARRLSEYMAGRKDLQDSSVAIIAIASHSFLVTSEGSRIREADNFILLTADASLQADDGMLVSDSCMFAAEMPGELPSADEMQARIDQMINNLQSLTKAEYLETYTGPVLFDNQAAGQLFGTLIAGQLAARPDPVGGRGSGSPLEKQLETRILPNNFQVYDDPNIKKWSDQILFGHYHYDEEGAPAKRVDLVKDGRLMDLVTSRAPTKKFNRTNGHGRSGSPGAPAVASIANVFFSCDDGVSTEELKRELIQAAKDEGLDYAVRVESFEGGSAVPGRAQIRAMLRGGGRRGGGSPLPNPLHVYKVYVEDGREEQIRGLQFGAIKSRDLKRVIAAGASQEVFNTMGRGYRGFAGPAAIIAPPVILEDVQLNKIEQEFDKKPFLEAPVNRLPDAA